ncbi:hypothetical protein VB005_07903 [Metarhizium brunneum]
MSVLILYLHLFSVLQWMRIVSITGIVVISLWHLSTCIAFAVMCSPTRSSHLDFLHAFFSSKCSRTWSLVVIQGIGNVVTDVFRLVLPLPVVWTLRIPLGRKLGVSSMFLVGLSACASSAMRLYYRALYYDAGQNNIRLVVTVWTTAGSGSRRHDPLHATHGRTVQMLETADKVVEFLSPEMLLIYVTRGAFTILSPAPSARKRYTAWVDTEVDTLSLREMNLANGSVRKKTKVKM